MRSEDSRGFDEGIAQSYEGGDDAVRYLAWVRGNLKTESYG